MTTMTMQTTRFNVDTYFINVSVLLVENDEGEESRGEEDEE